MDGPEEAQLEDRQRDVARIALDRMIRAPGSSVAMKPSRSALPGILSTT